MRRRAVGCRGRCAETGRAIEFFPSPSHALQPSGPFLVTGHPSFEEIGEFLDILQVHEGERVFAPVSRRETEIFQALVCNEAEIISHVPGGEPSHSMRENVISEGHFTINGV